jgi:hypothetical protein
MRLRLRAAILAAIAYLRPASNKRPEEPQDIGQASDPEDNPADNGQQPATDVLRTELAAFQTLIREIHRSEKQHQAAEHNIWDAQLRTAKRLNEITIIGAIFSFFGILGLIFSLLIAKQAADDARVAAYAARDQAQAVQIANRPWIPPNVNIPSDVLIYREGSPPRITQITVPLHFVFKNVGHTPAVFSTVRPFMTNTKVETKDIVAEQSEFCDTSKHVPTEGQSVFPDQSIPYDVAIIDMLGTTTLNIHPSISFVIIDSGKALNTVEIIGIHRVLWPIIAGCIIYKFGTGNDFGASGFAYRLLRGGTPDLHTGQGLLLDDVQGIAKESVFLEPMGEGNLFFTR